MRPVGGDTIELVGPGNDVIVPDDSQRLPSASA